MSDTISSEPLVYHIITSQDCRVQSNELRSYLIWYSDTGLNSNGVICYLHDLHFVVVSLFFSRIMTKILLNTLDNLSICNLLSNNNLFSWRKQVIMTDLDRKRQVEQIYMKYWKFDKAIHKDETCMYVNTFETD